MKSTKNIIIERVETFRRNKDTLKKTYNEEMLRIEYINPFLKHLVGTLQTRMEMQKPIKM